MTAAVSPSSLPQSSTGRFDVKQRRGALVAAHDELEQIFRRGVRQLPHARGRR